MSKLQYFNYPGWGETARELHNLSQVVRIGNELRISGQGRRSVQHFSSRSIILIMYLQAAGAKT